MKKVILVLLVCCSFSIFSYSQEQKAHSLFKNKVGIFLGNSVLTQSYSIQAHYLFYKDVGMGIEYYNPAVSNNVMALNLTVFTGLPTSLKDIKLHTSMGLGYYWGKNFNNTVKCPVVTYDLGLDFPILKEELCSLYLGFHCKGYSSFNKNNIYNKSFNVVIGLGF